MKKLLSLSLIFILLLSACQENPTSDIIDQKGNLSQTENENKKENSSNIADYSVPEKWSESVSFDNSEITVEIDAEIEIPDTDMLSTYKINESAGISQERIDILIDEFFGNNQLIDANREMTKSEIEDLILNLKQRQAEAGTEQNEERRGNISFSVMQDGDDSPIVMNDAGAIFDRMIETYEEMLATAPETVEDVPLNPSVAENGADFVNFSGTGTVDGKGTYNINYMASEKNNITPNLNIGNSEYSLIETDDSEEQFADKAPSKEEAIAKANELLQKLGLTGMVISEVSFAKQTVSGDMFSGFSESETTGNYGYIVKYTREVDGVKCIDGTNFGGISISSAPGRSGGGSGGGGRMTFGSAAPMQMNTASFRRSMGNEDLTIGVTQNGIEEISWSGYFEIGDTITEDASLLSFDEVKELFKKNMELTYTVTEPEENGRFNNFFTMSNLSNTYNIYKASLCYTKSVVQNDSDNSMLVPVWAFYSYQVDENGTSVYTPSPVLIINAIDGSII